MVSAVRALHPAGPVDVVGVGVDGHGPTLVAVDARGEATRPAITFLDTRATAELAELEASHRPPRLGARPAAGGPVAGTARTGDRRCDPLVPDDLGVAGAPPDRRGRPAARRRPGRARPRRHRSIDRAPRRPTAARVGHGRRGRPTGARRGRCARAAARDPGRRRHERRLRQLSRRGPHPSRRCLRPGRVGGRVRRLLGSAGRGAGRVRDARAAARPVQRRRGDGLHGTGARLVSRPRSSAGRSPRMRSSPRRPRPLPAPTGWSSCRTSPGSARHCGTRRRVACSPV